MKEMIRNELEKVSRSFWILKDLEYWSREFEIYLIGDEEPWKDFKQKSDAF